MWISTPKLEKTCANSTAMYPPPRMTMLVGRASSRMMVSEVWNSTPDFATTGGIDGRPPVAITICSASMRVSSLITNSCGPAKRA